MWCGVDLWSCPFFDWFCALLPILKTVFPLTSQCMYENLDALKYVSVGLQVCCINTLYKCCVICHDGVVFLTRMSFDLSTVKII